MPSNDEDLTPLITQLAERFYSQHVYAGRAYISISHALECAAVVVGAAQSSVMHQLISEARANPKSWLEKLSRTQVLLAEQVDAHRKQQIAEMAQAMKGGESNQVDQPDAKQGST